MTVQLALSTAGSGDGAVLARPSRVPGESHRVKRLGRLLNERLVLSHETECAQRERARVSLLMRKPTMLLAILGLSASGGGGGRASADSTIPNPQIDMAAYLKVARWSCSGRGGCRW